MPDLCDTAYREDVLAFYLVFAVFVIATVALVVLTMRWARRRDRERSVSHPES